ncbi:hypothetical protein NA78x_004034 [Anatilimnocola sp. NA78]|uniref:hypothetical protein n=1 Tax=Anatilimnocola sp. NA78 TaxID=3415683 RepID=UPI003CE4D248
MKSQFSITDLLVAMTLVAIAVGFALRLEEEPLVGCLAVTLSLSGIVGGVVGICYSHLRRCAGWGMIGGAMGLLFTFCFVKYYGYSLHRDTVAGIVGWSPVFAFAFASVAAVFHRRSWDIILWPTVNFAAVVIVPGSLALAGVFVGAAWARVIGQPWQSPVGSGEVFFTIIFALCTAAAMITGVLVGSFGLLMRDCFCHELAMRDYAKNRWPGDLKKAVEPLAKESLVTENKLDENC